MAAANAFRAKTASVFASAKTGIKSLKIKNGGTSSDLTSDASPAVNAIFVDMLACDVSIVLTDFAGATALVAGDTGALIVTFEKRAEGRGAAVSGTPITATFSNAVLLDIDFNAATIGIGDVTLNLRCSSPTGGSAVAWT